MARDAYPVFVAPVEPATEVERGGSIVTKMVFDNEAGWVPPAATLIARGKALEERCDRLERQVQRADGVARVAEIESDRAKRRTIEAERERDRALFERDAARSLQAGVNTINATLRRQLDEAERAANIRVNVLAGLRRDMDMVARQRDAARADRAQFRADLDRVQVNLDSARLDNQELSERVRRSRVAPAHFQITELANQVGELRRERDKLRERLTRTGERCAKLKTELAQASAARRVTIGGWLAGERVRAADVTAFADPFRREQIVNARQNGKTGQMYEALNAENTRLAAELAETRRQLKGMNASFAGQARQLEKLRVFRRNVDGAYATGEHPTARTATTTGGGGAAGSAIDGTVTETFAGDGGWVAANPHLRMPFDSSFAVPGCEGEQCSRRRRQGVFRFTST